MNKITRQLKGSKWSKTTCPVLSGLHAGRVSDPGPPMPCRYNVTPTLPRPSRPVPPSPQFRRHAFDRPQRLRHNNTRLIAAPRTIYTMSHTVRDYSADFRRPVRPPRHLPRSLRLRNRHLGLYEIMLYSARFRSQHARLQRRLFSYYSRYS